MGTMTRQQAIEELRGDYRGKFAQAMALALSDMQRVERLEALLIRVEKYAREDGARTVGYTRFARVLDEVRAVLPATAKSATATRVEA